jgi:nucleoside-diphosphate-sugar epimerase
VRRVIYAASSSAYGDQPTLPKIEQMRPNPLSAICRRQIDGRILLSGFHTRLQSGNDLPAYLTYSDRANPSSMYSGVISRFIDALMKSDTPVIYGDGEQSRDFTFVANVVNANINAALTDKGIGEVMNAANGERITLNDLLEVLKNITGKSDRNG